jgi:hypothetical protein
MRPATRRRPLSLERLEDRTQPSAVAGLIATGTDGAAPHVKVFNPDGSPRFSFFAYPVTFNGGVHVAAGDVTGDGVADVITAPAFATYTTDPRVPPGPGGFRGVMGPLVKVFDGRTGAEVASFLAYDVSYLGGVNVAAADLNNDGRAEIITGTTGAGGAPHVKVFDGRTRAVLRSFFAYDPGFLGGVNVAVGNVDGDSVPDLITGAGPGGGPHVKVFSGADGSLLRSFFALDPSFNQGVAVAAAADADGQADILAGPQILSAPTVKVFRGDLSLRSSFTAFPGSGGVRLSSADVDGDGVAEVLTAASYGYDGGEFVRAFRRADGTQLRQFAPYDRSYLGGVNVAGAVNTTVQPVGTDP